MAHDIEKLDKKIRRLHESISEFAKLPPGFGGIIHRGGWTTIVEYLLVEAGIDSLQTQVESATKYCKRLLEAADKVGQTSSH
jgi:hypothetical protein